MTQKDRLYRKIVKRFSRTIRECDQMLIDFNYWMGLNPNESPLDLEPVRLTKAMAEKLLAKFRRGERLEDAEMAEYIKVAGEGL